MERKDKKVKPKHLEHAMQDLMARQGLPIEIARIAIRHFESKPNKEAATNEG